jgi:hypothetical protein
MDKLEEFIKNNREDLDRYIPPSGIWKGVNRRLRMRKYPFNRWLAIAAMFVVILGSAVILFRSGNIVALNARLKGSDASLNSLSPQLKETEIYYNNMVNSLYREASPMLTANPEIEKELSTDISQLDSICVEIKKDLKDNVDNQEVVEALIQNYRIKIRILEDMLTLLKENNTLSDKTKENEL